MNSETILTLEKIIGYTFKDKALLERALTHSSKTQDATKNYQSLEFLGDSILDFIVAKRLMEIYPCYHEGELTKLRANIVSKEPLSQKVQELGLENYLKVQSGEDKDIIRHQAKIMSDIFEAITAAIYLDSGDIHEAERFILSKLSSNFNEMIIEKPQENYKSKLNEYANKYNLVVDYDIESQEGAVHDPTFNVLVKVGGICQGRGSGKSKKEAEQAAAKDALSYLIK